jgi:CubicO group peptidase (beta-lactamase class C family)
MTHTCWEYTKVPPGQLAYGYRWLNQQWVKQPMLHDGAYGAMGGMITTIEDFANYVAFHLSVWPPSNDKETGPVKRSSVREMQHPWNVSILNTAYKYPAGRTCPIVSSYGYGLGWVKDCDGKTMVGHSGGLPGFGSQWRILPEYGIGVISFSNLTYASAGFINVQVLDTLVALAGLRPRQLPPSSILNQRKDQLVSLLPDWNIAKASGIFAQNFFLDYSVDSLRKEASTLFTRAGPINRIYDLIPENQLRGAFIMEGEKTSIQVSFTLTPEHTPLIQEYRIREVGKNGQ